MEPHKIMLVGGITQQGPTGVCHTVDLRGDGTIISSGSMIESRAIPLLFGDSQRMIVMGGNPKHVLAEEYDQESQQWVPIDVAFDSEVGVYLQSGLRGFSVSTQGVLVSNEIQQVPQPLNTSAEDYGLLIGNDEFPFILTIPKNLSESEDKVKLLAVPSNLQM